jgi:hypothetical protein
MGGPPAWGLGMGLATPHSKNFYCCEMFQSASDLVRKTKGKRPLGRPRRRWDDNIKMDFREIGIDGANWIQLAQDRVQWRACVNTVMNLRFP